MNHASKLCAAAPIPKHSPKRNSASPPSACERGIFFATRVAGPSGCSDLCCGAHDFVCPRWHFGCSWESKGTTLQCHLLPKKECLIERQRWLMIPWKALFFGGGGFTWHPWQGASQYLPVSTHLKNMLVKLDHFPPKNGVENQQYLKPPPRNETRIVCVWEKIAEELLQTKSIEHFDYIRQQYAFGTRSPKCKPKRAWWLMNQKGPSPMTGHDGWNRWSSNIHYEVNKGLRQEFWSSSAGESCWRFSSRNLSRLWKEFPNFSTPFHWLD